MEIESNRNRKRFFFSLPLQGGSDFYLYVKRRSNAGWCAENSVGCQQGNRLSSRAVTATPIIPMYHDAECTQLPSPHGYANAPPLLVKGAAVRRSRASTFHRDAFPNGPRNAICIARTKPSLSLPFPSLPFCRHAGHVVTGPNRRRQHSGRCSVSGDRRPVAGDGGSTGSIPRTGGGC